MIEVTVSEFALITVITVVAALIGMLYVSLVPRRCELITIHVILVAPALSGLMFVLIFSVIGFANVRPGGGVLGVIRAAAALGLLYGFGAGVFGMPGAMVGGLIGALIRRWRLRCSHADASQKRISD